MADFNIIGGSVITRDVISGDTGVIAQNGTLTVFSGNAIEDSGAPANDVSVINNGSVYADRSVVKLDGVSATVTNRGHMSSRSIVLDFDGTNASNNTHATVINYGEITGMENGADGIFCRGGANYIVNAGSIFGHTDDALDIGGTANSVKNVIINIGTIASSTVSPNAGAIATADAKDEITNSGTITGNILTKGANDKVINSGAVFGNIELGNGADTYDGRGGTLRGQVEGGRGNDSYYVDGQGTKLVEGAGDGDDTVYSNGNFRLDAHIENLTLLGSNNTAGHGNGLDNVLTGNAGANSLRGQGGRDRLNGEGGNDELRGQDGADRLDGGTGDDRLLGGASNDELKGEGGADVLLGGTGNDTLSGGRDDDRLLGHSGADELTGNAGNDSLKGGTGNDTFLFFDGFGMDTILDFDANANGEDISLKHVSTINGWADLRNNHMSQKGSDVVIDAGDDNTIRLKGVAIGDLDAADFLF